MSQPLSAVSLPEDRKTKIGNSSSDAVIIFKQIWGFKKDITLTFLAVSSVYSNCCYWYRDILKENGYLLQYVLCVDENLFYKDHSLLFIQKYEYVI